MAEVRTEGNLVEEEVMTDPTTPEATTTETRTVGAPLLDEVAHTTTNVVHRHEEEVVPGTTKLPKQVKTPIRLEPVVLEVLELEARRAHVEVEVGLEVDQEEMTEEEMAIQEVEEEDEAEAHAETTRNRKKLSINQTQRTARVMLAASKKP